MLSTTYHVGCCEQEELHSREVSDGGLCCITQCAMLSAEQLAHMPARRSTSACTCPGNGVRCLHHTHMDHVMCGRQPRVLIAAIG